MGRRAALWILTPWVFLHVTLAAQDPHTGREMFRAWCAVCHGEDGKGSPLDRPVKTPPPDLTNCRLSTSETDADWTRVVIHGGVAAGLSSEMPGFEMLASEQIRELVSYLRAFCNDSRWPDSNLNFPRPLFTSKAFPESEAVLQPMVSHGASTNTRMRMEASYAFRVGHRGQLEGAVPAETVKWEDGWIAGIGDVRAEGKYVLYASAERKLIASAGISALFRTGSRRWGFGEGTTTIEPFLAAGVAGHRLYLQADIRGLLPGHRFPTEPIRYVGYDASVLRPLSASPTGWIIGAELNGTDKAFGITPEIMKGLTRSGAILAGLGVRVPVTSPTPFNSDLTRWAGFLIWDYLQPIRARR